MTVSILYNYLGLLMSYDGVVFNIFSVLTFYCLVGAIYNAIRRGMGTHASVILYEHGIKGLSDYALVCD